MANKNQEKYPAEDDYPNFDKHSDSCLLSQHCTKDVYTKLRSVETSSGFTLDKAIQNGVDNAGR